MPRKHCRVPWKRSELLQAAIDLVRVTTRKIGPSAAFQEQRVSGDEPAVEQKALAAGRVTRSVQQLDFDSADADLVAMLVGGEVAEADSGDPRNPKRFVGIYVYGHTRPIQQLGQALQLKTHHRAADMIGVMMGDQHTGQVHAVSLEGVDQVTGGVRRVYHYAVSGLTIANQVGEIAHLRRDHVAGGEIATGEQLTEVQPVR